MSLDARENNSVDWMQNWARRKRRLWLNLIIRWRIFYRAVNSRLSSSLTRRIIVLNIGGLVALLIGFLYLNQFRAGLIEARVQSLETQGEIIAAAIAASATVETDAITIDPEKLLQLAPGESYGVADENSPYYEFSINPEKIGPVLHRLASPSRARARIFDRDGELLLDSLALTPHSTILRTDLPPKPLEKTPRFFDRLWNEIKNRFSSAELQSFDDNGIPNGKDFPEIGSALAGSEQAIVRLNMKGETIVSVGIPIERFHAVRGALLLSTQGSDIDKIITSERWAIFRIFLASVVIMFLLSIFIAGTIAEPIRRLAEAADRVRRGIRSRQEIPDFTDRADEIGHLSGALRDMTRALYNRIEAIESFAADVAHELKNPLTSLRSAVETLPIAKTSETQGRLLAIIEHDVRRLDRLISDISDASRLDAELARGDMELVDLSRLLEAVVSITNQVQLEETIQVRLEIVKPRSEESRKRGFLTYGHDSRLGQVFNNLIDNARSFSSGGGLVKIVLRSGKGSNGNGYFREGFEIIVDDEGPGIPADAFERIFERFYTDRPNQGFGQNSGLGLSISRQIIEAHGGTIRALNRMGKKDGGETPVLGARFVIWLPRAK
jgi:two-component system sensor histidine kinase ChvG